MSEKLGFDKAIESANDIGVGAKFDDGVKAANKAWDKIMTDGKNFPKNKKHMEGF